MNYKVIHMEDYYRCGVFRHFSEDCKCSVSITSRVNVTKLHDFSKQTGTKFYINFLYLLSSVLNSREDYRMSYLYQTNELIMYDKINPTHYIFHEDTETCTPVYTEYDADYRTFYRACEEDMLKGKQTREYGLESAGHPNWFDASYISWLSYDSLHIELPDGYLYFMSLSLISVPVLQRISRMRQEDTRRHFTSRSLPMPLRGEPKRAAKISAIFRPFRLSMN